MVAGLDKRLPVGRDNFPTVFQRRRRFASWCGALTDSRSANIRNKLTQVRGVLAVIHRSKCLFCKLGANLLQFHPERNALAVAIIWTNGLMDCFVTAYYSAHKIY